MALCKKEACTCQKSTTTSFLLPDICARCGDEAAVSLQPLTGVAWDIKGPDILFAGSDAMDGSAKWPHFTASD